tara:strand:- start:72 stop:794 length:723 start_codon:yes stop_codon:yes gene_type:complete
MDSHNKTQIRLKISELSSPVKQDDLVLGDEISLESLIGTCQKFKICKYLAEPNTVNESFLTSLPSFENAPDKIIDWLHSHSSQVFKRRLSSSISVDSLLDELDPFIDSISSATRIKEKIFLFVDELFSNSNKASTKEHDVIIALSVSEKYFRVSFLDYVGALMPERFVDLVAKCLEVGIEENINQNKNVGAGIGLTLLLKQSSFVSVLAKKAHFSCVTFEAPLSRREIPVINSILLREYK